MLIILCQHLRVVELIFRYISLQVYFKVKVVWYSSHYLLPRCWFRWHIATGVIDGIVDTGGKFATGIKDTSSGTGGKI